MEYLYDRNCLNSYDVNELTEFLDYQYSQEDIDYYYNNIKLDLLDEDDYLSYFDYVFDNDID